MKFSLSIFLPIAMGSLKLLCWNLSDASKVRILTTVFFTFGTSIPIVPLPGIGAIIRIPSADRLRAISSSRFFIREIRTPGAGTISYKVTVGPTVALIF
jgi:hypothetical protein